MSWVNELAVSLPSITWILPQADTGPVTFSGGAAAHRPRWFDVQHLPPSEDEDSTLGAAVSREKIQQILRDVPSGKIFLVGFSQGSAMAMLSSLTGNHNISGIAVLSGWLPPMLRKLVQEESRGNCLPVFWAHGTADSAIPLQNALETMTWLRSSFALERLDFHEYLGLDHSVNDEVLRDLRVWLASLL